MELETFPSREIINTYLQRAITNTAGHLSRIDREICERIARKFGHQNGSLVPSNRKDCIDLNLSVICDTLTRPQFQALSRHLAVLTQVLLTLPHDSRTIYFTQTKEFHERGRHSV